jgi:hypothetical protein
MKANEENDVAMVEKEKTYFQTNMTEMTMGQCSQKQEDSKVYVLGRGWYQEAEQEETSGGGYEIES